VILSLWQNQILRRKEILIIWFFLYDKNQIIIDPYFFVLWQYQVVIFSFIFFLFTMSADFRSISSSITTFVSIIHCLWLITKKLSLFLYTERINHMLLRTNMIRWTKILWGINNFGHDKCSNQSSQIRALITYYENKEMNKGYENENILFFSYIDQRQRVEYIQMMYPF